MKKCLLGWMIVFALPVIGIAAYKYNTIRHSFESKLLKQYPSIENALSGKITVEKVVDKKEHLEIKYLIIYNSKGSILQMQNCSFITDSCGRLSIGV